MECRILDRGLPMRCVFLALVLVCGCGGPASPPVQSGFAEFGQSKLYYEVAGQGSPTVILLHGGMLDCTMWDEQFALLAKSHRAVRYDASAHGQSALPPEAYWDHSDLRGLMDHLQIDQAVLVGLSMGGRVAIDMALEEPTRVRAVVAVSSGLGGYRFESDFHMKNRKQMIAAWKSGDFDAVVEAFQREWTDGPQRSPDEVDPKVRERVRAMARNTVGSVMEGRSLQPPAIDRLAELSVPMLVVVGELDMPGIHEIADLLVEADPNAELITVPGVAHMVNLEASEEFDRVLLEFLEKFQ
jgi:pimeloyl-ACP methyl ester carboxylesterase